MKGSSEKVALDATPGVAVPAIGLGGVVVRAPEAICPVELPHDTAARSIPQMQAYKAVARPRTVTPIPTLALRDSLLAQKTDRRSPIGRRSVAQGGREWRALPLRTVLPAHGPKAA